ncbi:hypothetical protein DCC35_18275 [Mangrovivirga cuniculi]|uniref:Uncharacterized protein n=1 Tax=Mangrovivirga cuniculi TaxID=2715131 RepID=A0A4D7KAW1_9BACT|nr:hypothetical protein DCC35_18275 [Mangrovivirga cuniculi]
MGPTQGEIDEKYEIIRGKVSGPYHLLRIKGNLRVITEGSSFRSYDFFSSIYDEEEKENFSKLWRHYYNGIFIQDTVATYDSAYWISEVEKIKADTEVGDTLFRGKPIRFIISDKPEVEQFVTFKIEGQDGLFDLRDYLFDVDYNPYFKTFRESQPSYNQYVSKVKELIEDNPQMGIKVLRSSLADSSDYLPHRVYSAFDHKDELLLEDVRGYESRETRLIKEDGMYTEEDNNEFIVWYDQFNFKLYTGLILIWIFISFIKSRNKNSRKPVFGLDFQYHPDGRFSWEITDRNEANAYELPINQLQVHVYMNEDNKADILGLAIEDTSSENFWHFYGKDYLINESLLQKLKGLPGETIKVHTVERVFESIIEERSWKQVYTLESGEEHSYTSQYER